MADKIYAVVLFPPDEKDSAVRVNAIPQSWLVKSDVCVWPGSGYDAKKMIKDCTAPPDPCTWPRYKVVKQRENIEGLSKAHIIERNVLNEKEENLSEEASKLPPKRPRVPASKFSPFKENDSADDECSPIKPGKKISRISVFSTPPNTGEDTSPLPTPPNKQNLHNVTRNLVLSDASNKKNKSKVPVSSRPDDRNGNGKCSSNLSPDASSSSGILNKNNSDASLSGSTDPSSEAVNKHLNKSSSPANTSSDAVNKLNLNASAAPISNAVEKGSGKTLVAPVLQQFQTTWAGMNKEQQSQWKAETLFILRKSLPAIMGNKGAPVLQANSQDPFKTDLDFACFPINDDENLKMANQKMRKKGFKSKLRAALMRLKCTNVNETARKMFEVLFTDHFGKAYSMQGKKKKKVFLSLPVAAFLLETLFIAYNPRYEAEKIVDKPNEEITAAVNAWLVYCNNRIKKKLSEGNRGKKHPAEIPVSDEDEE